MNELLLFAQDVAVRGWDLINSQFGAAMTGAFAGAMAAHKIAIGSKRRDELAQQMREINVAATLAYTCANSALGSKSQHVVPLVTKFREQHEAFAKVLAAKRAGEPIPPVFRLALDFTNFPPISVPVEPLREALLNRILVGGIALAAASELERAVSGLRDLIDRREKKCQLLRNLAGEELACVYFGEQTPSGHVDHEYADSIAGIASYTNDIIYFAALLCEELCSVAVQIAKDYKREFRKEGKKPPTISFDLARERGLMPDPADYADWRKGFRKHEAKSK